MFVYFIQQEDGGPVKIGKAERPDRRLDCLQLGNPNILVIRAVCLGGLGAERRLHRHFKNDRIDREWFRCSPALESLMDRLPSWSAVQNGAACPEIIGVKEPIICRLYEEGYTHRDIAEYFGFTYQRSQQIVSAGKDWSPNSTRNRKSPDEPIDRAHERLVAEYADSDLLPTCEL